jgi:hypothetical protein
MSASVHPIFQEVDTECRRIGVSKKDAMMALAAAQGPHGPGDWLVGFDPSVLLSVLRTLPDQAGSSALVKAYQALGNPMQDT